MRILSCVLVFGLACRSETPIVETELPRPTFQITSPERASWNPAGTAVITGELKHIDRLLINGEAYPSEDGPLAIPIELTPGIQTLEIEAVGLDGTRLFDRRSILAGNFAQPDGSHTDLALSRINQGGLDDVAVIVAEAVDVQFFNQDFSTINPVVDLEYSMGTGLEVALKNIYFNEPHIELNAVENQLEVEVTLPNVYVDSDALVSVLWMESVDDLEFRADYAVGTLHLKLDALDGNVVIDPTYSEVIFEGFEYDLSLIPGEFIEDNVYQESIKQSIEDGLAWCMETLIPEILVDMQEDLGSSFEIDFWGAQFVLETVPSDVGVDNDGVWVDLGLDITAAAQEQIGEGYLYTGTDTPSPDTLADGSLMVSDDAINRVLYELWTSGLFSQTLSTRDGTIQNDTLTQYGVRELTVMTHAGLPPVLLDQDGSLEIQMGEIDLHLMTPNFGLGELMVLRLAAKMNLDVVFENGFVRPVLSNLQIQPDVLETDWMEDEENMVELLEKFVTPELLLGSLENIEIPIPSIDGLTIDSAQVDRTNPAAHTSLELNISPD